MDQTFDLFAALGATEEQLDFPIVYTIALQGTATLDPAAPGTDLLPLFETIVSHIPPPTGDPDAPLQLRVTTLDYDDYKGRIAIGRVNAGTVKSAQNITVINREGINVPGKLAQVFIYQGLNRVEVEQAEAGEIVAISGLPDVNIGETIASRENPVALPHDAGGRADPADDLRRQHVPAGRARGPVFDLAQPARAPDEGTPDQRRPARRGHRFGGPVLAFRAGASCTWPS